VNEAVGRGRLQETATPTSVFQRLFPKRSAPPLSDALLLALSETMNDGDSPADESSRFAHSRLFAGYTYLGQFIDHELTLDRTRFRMQPLADSALRNSRRPRFDLESLYGNGPGPDPDLYADDGRHLALDGIDLARRPSGTARIKDARNDSNRIVSQLQVAFARFHNRVVDELSGDGRPPPSATVEAARQVVCRHFQWIVIHDFLPTIVGQDLVDELLSNEASPQRRGLRLFNPTATPFMPLEFSAAAFRFGHSMVRSAYRLNRRSGMQFLFERDKPFDATAIDLRGFRPLSHEMRIEWDHFFEFPNGGPPTLQLARPIDPLIARPLFQLPFGAAHDTTPRGQTLAYRNLVRGETVHGLPTGQEVALEMRRLGIEIDAAEILGLGEPLKLEVGQLLRGRRDDLGGTGIGVAQLEDAVGRCTPLWYYILKEAAHFHAGERLGKVGGRIVAETIVGLMLADPDSILGSRDRWTPKAGEFGCETTGRYRMTELLAYAAAAPIAPPVRPSAGATNAPAVPSAR
jgi:hypothetical protein